MLKRFLYKLKHLKGTDIPGWPRYARHDELQGKPPFVMARSDLPCRSPWAKAGATWPSRKLTQKTEIFSFIKCIVLSSSLLLSFAAKASTSLNLQVSIKPLHSITAFICQGLVEPGLLMTGQESAHTQALTPQQLQALQKADLVVWIGPEYESQWQQPLHQQVKSEKILSLGQCAGLTLYPYRHQGLSPDHAHSHKDGHIWLDLHNAGVIAQAIAQAVIKLDPDHESLYKKNLSEFLAQLGALENELKRLLAPLKGKEYLIYHDGLQYFDRFFGLKMTASLVAEPHCPPNAQDFLRLKAWLTATPLDQRPACVFTEPGFDTAMVENLATTFHLKSHSVDYIGQEITAGPQAYFLMMRQLAADVLKGLS